MLHQVKKYIRIKAEAMQKMKSGDLEGYIGKLRELYELRRAIPNTATVPVR